MRSVALFSVSTVKGSALLKDEVKYWTRSQYYIDGNDTEAVRCDLTDRRDCSFEQVRHKGDPKPLARSSPAAL